MRKELQRKRKLLRSLIPSKLPALIKRVTLLLAGVFLPTVYFLATVVQSELDQSFAVPSSVRELTTVDQFLLGMSCLISSSITGSVAGSLTSALGLAMGVFLATLIIRDGWNRFPTRLRRSIFLAHGRMRDRLLLAISSPSILALSAAATLSCLMVPLTATMALVSQFLRESGQYAHKLADQRHAMADRCARQISYVNDLPCTEIAKKDGSSAVGLLVSTANGRYHLADGMRTAVISGSDVAFTKTVNGTRKPPEVHLQPLTRR